MILIKREYFILNFYLYLYHKIYILKCILYVNIHFIYLYYNTYNSFNPEREKIEFGITVNGQ